MSEKSVQWKLVVAGVEELSQADRVFAISKIAELIEVFEETEGSFTITEDEE